MTEEQVKIQTKVCTKCGIEKPITEFYKHKGYKYDVKSKCKDCYILKVKKYREENFEYYKEYNKKYREENSEYYKEYKKKYNKKHYQENINLHRLKSKKRRAKKKQALGNLTSSDIKKLNSHTNCYYCGYELNDNKELNNYKRHHDHFIPISKNGTEYVENYKSVCQGCNLSKNNKLPHIWLKEQGLLEEYDRKSTEKYINLNKKETQS